jgi:acyl transferase domain-containing protein
MLAVLATADAIADVLGQPADIWVANLNSPRQTVLAGTGEAIDAALARLTAAGLSARRIPVACAFHSPLVAAAGRLMADLLGRTEIQAPRIPVFSNTLATVYPSDASAIRQTLSEHITAPVRFAEQLEAMWEAGARIFVEVGPRSVLSNLVRETLVDRRPLVLTIDSSERHGVTQLLHVVAQLAVAGICVDFDELWRGRNTDPVQLSKLPAPRALPAHVWMVNGGRARRQGDPIVDLKAAKAARRAQAEHHVTAAAARDAKPDSGRETVQAHAAPKSEVDVPRSESWPAAQTGSTGAVAVLQGEVMHSESPNQVPQIVVDGGTSDVMRQFQQLMSQFLQTQALVMTAYLQGAPAQGTAQTSFPSSVPRQVPQRPLAPVGLSPIAAAPPAPVAAPMPVAAAVMPTPVAPPAPAPVVAKVPTVVNGVNGMNGAAPMNGMNGANGAANGVPASAAEAKAPQPAKAAVSVLGQLLEIVSDRTGYPQDMLSVDAHMEADLGIDSIKRMEILTAFQQMHAGEQQRGAFQGAMERLTAINTLRETAAVLEELVAAQGGAAVAEVHAS